MTTNPTPTTEQDTAFRDAQVKFYDAAASLLDAWLRHPDHLLGTEDYPFEESFEEVVARVGAWVYRSES